MNLRLTTRRRVRLQLLVNTTPSKAGSIAAMRANMSAVIPALKVLSQIDVRNGSMDVAFLDLTKRRVTFEQRDIRNLASRASGRYSLIRSSTLSMSKTSKSNRKFISSSAMKSADALRPEGRKPATSYFRW